MFDDESYKSNIFELVQWKLLLFNSALRNFYMISNTIIDIWRQISKWS